MTCSSAYWTMRDPHRRSMFGTPYNDGADGCIAHAFARTGTDPSPRCSCSWCSVAELPPGRSSGPRQKTSRTRWNTAWAERRSMPLTQWNERLIRPARCKALARSRPPDRRKCRSIRPSTLSVVSHPRPDHSLIGRGRNVGVRPAPGTMRPPEPASAMSPHTNLAKQPAHGRPGARENSKGR